MDNNDNNNGDIPTLFRWNGDIDKLLQDFKNKNVIKEDRKKIVTHTNSMIYDYNECFIYIHCLFCFFWSLICMDPRLIVIKHILI